MSDTHDHGQRISGAEYDRRVVALQDAQPAMPTPAQDRDVRRRELDLRIDHCLGEAFPAERRDALWAVAESLERHRVRHGLRALWRRVTGHPSAGPEEGGALAGVVAEAYANVLSPQELRAFLGLGEGEIASLPAAGSH